MHLPGRTLAVTGVGGCIGRRLAEMARDRGLQVRGLDVSPIAAERARQAGIEAKTGDIGDPEAAEWLCRGADAVAHCAGVTREGAPWRAFRRVDVEGTQTVVAAAKKAGVARLVYVSSVAVYGFRYPPMATEEAPLAEGGHAYGRGKIAAERAVMAAHDPDRLGVAVLRAGNVYGPEAIPFVMRPIQEMRRGWFPIVSGDGIMSHLYVDNLADAVFLALERDATGEAFNITDGQATSCREYYARLARMTVPVRLIEVPRWLARPAAWVLRTVAACLRTRTAVTGPTVDFLAGRPPYSIDKARHELGYEPRVLLEEGMRRTEQWFRSHGGVPITDRSVLSAR